MKGHIRPRNAAKTTWELKFDLPSEDGGRKTKSSPTGVRSAKRKIA